MSISYTAYIFIGAEVSEDHFRTKGKETYRCQTHGPKPKKFCDDCGQRCIRHVEQLWTEDMVKAAKTMGKTPKELWKHLDPDGGRCFDYVEDRTFGLWKFGYECGREVWGIVIARSSDNDLPGGSNWVITTSQLAETLVLVENNFRMYGIDTPVKILCLQDCG